MYFEINVSHNGRHFFATAERSIWDMTKLKQVYYTLKKKFPTSEGYEISVTKYENSGRRVQESEIV